MSQALLQCEFNVNTHFVLNHFRIAVDEVSITYTAQTWCKLINNNFWYIYFDRIVDWNLEVHIFFPTNFGKLKFCHPDVLFFVLTIFQRCSHHHTELGALPWGCDFCCCVDCDGHVGEVAVSERYGNDDQGQWDVALEALMARSLLTPT